jgi:hypothetical protein
MPRLTLADLTAEPTTFELDGHTYTVVPMTRAVQVKHDAALAKFQESDSEDSDKNIDMLSRCIETLVKGEGDAPPLSKALAAAWKRDDVTLGQIHRLYESAQEAALERPTSRRTN